ncbi:P-type conjugative transfer protein TrbG [Asticcacaulis sp. W401b]|uniref:P-type conjugative transfer protein TrbG n=1 Tax=Asticcacaulis sp. W401b TaxID=3388666 RepID=UPI003970EF40
MTPSRLLTITLALTLFAAAAADARPKGRLSPRPAVAQDRPADEVRKANEAARVEPASDSFANAVQVYPYTPGALYRVYTSVGKVTDIALQPGEQLTGSGPIAAGDTVRWIIGSTESGTGTERQVHILIKPTANQLSTNLVINTDRRTYHIEVQALPSTYMASVSWRYPLDEMKALEVKAERVREQMPVASGLTPETLNFKYRLEGAKVPWRPVRAFDDGRQVFIELPAAIAATDLPPLFLLGADGKAELVNYRVSHRFIIVDRLFSTAEMRIGEKSRQKAVRIRFTGGPRS